ncbi:MAG: cell division FtsA domain-containing protein [Clostridia bacterium]|nr:cell division FtsA domain-containing protein [Clostridia bacterium]
MKPVSILDIGSSKVVCLMGSRAARGGTVVHGTGVAAYSGYADGAFFDEKELEQAIVSAVKEAEVMSRRRIREVALSVPAPFSRLVLATGSLRFVDEVRITPEHTDELIDLSLEHVQVPGYRLMHSTPVVYTLDGYETAEKPEGKRAGSISAKVSHLYVKNEYIALIARILRGLSIEVTMSVSTPLSVSMLLIPEEERIRPAVLIDVGYLHTDVSLAENNAITNMTSIDMGGAQFASDLSFGLDIPFPDAEQVKRKYSFLVDDSDDDVVVVYMPQGAKRVRREVIELIMTARAEEFAGLIRDALERMGIRPEQQPVCYLTGGGFSMMRGGAEFLRSELGMRVRRDRPFLPTMDTPNYASAFGTLEFVLRELHGDEEEPVRETKEKQGIIKQVRKIFNK